MAGRIARSAAGRNTGFLLQGRGGFTIPWHLLSRPLAKRLVDIPTDSKQETEDMDEITFQRKMQELMSRIQAMPEAAESPAESVNEIGARRDRIKASVSELQESLDYLRLSVKYLVFDLEATRRENAYLRRMLEQSSRDAQRQIEDEEPNEDFGDEERFD